MKFNLLTTLLFVCIATLTFAQRTKDQIIINKRPSTTSTQTQTNTRTENRTLPSQSSTQGSRIQRVNHDFSKKLDNIELRYTVVQTGSNSNNKFYRIDGHIYSDIETEALFSHNKRIVLFQIDNWDSGFFGDDIQSIDGYATNQQLTQEAGGGPLYQFGNSPVREFSFEFKTKTNRQPVVKSQIYPDWRVLADYEQFMPLEFASMNGKWVSTEFPDTAFDLSFSTQGEQIAMTDFYGQQVYWTYAKEGTYVRQIGTVAQQGQTNTQRTSSGGYLGDSNNNTNQTNQTRSGNTPSNYPEGGYLGGSSNNSNNRNSSSTNSGNNSSSNYPSGGYLGNSNSNNQQGNNATSLAEHGYVSVFQIVDRRTMTYTNSEGISITLTKEE